MHPFHLLAKTPEVWNYTIYFAKQILILNTYREGADDPLEDTGTVQQQLDQVRTKPN